MATAPPTRSPQSQGARPPKADMRRPLLATQQVGKIVQCIGAVVDVEFPRDRCRRSIDALKTGNDGNRLTLEVQQQLGDDIVRTIAMDSTDGLTPRPDRHRHRHADPRAGRPGARSAASWTCSASRSTSAARSTPTSPRRSTRTAPAFDEQSTDRSELLETGIKVIDLLVPVRQGRQGRPVRRRRRRQDRDMMELINNIAKAPRRHVGVRRRRRAHPRRQRLLSRDSSTRASSQGPDGTPTRRLEGRDGVRPDERAAGQPPARRADRPDDGRIFPRREGQDVLFFVDNIYRFTLAGTEVSALLGRMPSAVGYQPTLAEEMGALQERITSTKKGSITSVQAVYVPADDLTDPSPATTFAHLDATTCSAARYRALGIYPAVDPLDSTSRAARPARRRPGALRHRARRAGDAAALQGAAGHHRHPRHGRAVAKKTS